MIKPGGATMSKQPVSQPSKKVLYAEYLDLAKKAGIETPKALSSFTNIKAVQTAIDFLKKGQEADEPKKDPKKVAKAKKAGAVPVKGNYVKLSPSDRAKLRRMKADGKLEHTWSSKWQLTQADYDRLLKGGAAAS